MKTFKKYIKFFVNIIILLIFPLFLNFSIVNTHAIQLDNFCKILTKNKINGDFYNFHYSICEIKNKLGTYEKYSDVLNKYYYSYEVESCRIIVDNDYSIQEIDGNFTLLTQDTFSIISNESSIKDGYRVDLGMYHAYFPPTFLGENREYLQGRFSSDAFVYINDRTADLLLDKYNIDSYDELIKNEEYCILNIKLANNVVIKTSINNILYSNKRDAGRTTKLYENFGLFYIKPRIQKLFSTRFEFDIKDNAFLLSHIFNDIEQLGYSTENYNYLFKTYSKDKESYSYDDGLAQQFCTLDAFKTNDYLLFIFFLLIILLSIVPFIYFSINHADRYKYYNLFFLLIFILLIEILSYFINLHKFFFLPFICPLAFFILLDFISLVKYLFTNFNFNGFYLGRFWIRTYYEKI